MNIIEALGGRKFILALIIVGTCTGLQVKAGLGVNESFTALMIGIMAAFGASNAYVTTKVAPKSSEGAPEASPAPEAVEESAAPAPPAQPDLGDIDKKFEMIVNALQQVSDQAKAANKNATAALSAITGRQ